MRGSVCVGWGMLLMFHQAVYNTTLVSTFCLSRASRSARGERSGLSRAFPQLAHAHCLLDLPKYAEAFQNPLWTSHSPALFLNLWSASFLSHLLSLPQAASVLNYYCWLFLTNGPREKAVHADWAESGQIKTNLGSGYFQGPSRQVK